MPDGSVSETSNRTIRDYKSKKRRTIEIKWPGTDRPLTLLYLHCAEQQEAYFAARSYFDLKAQELDVIAEPHFQIEMEYQHAFRMMLQPGACNPNARLFNSVDEVRHELTPNESRTIVEEHLAVQHIENAEWMGEQANGHIRQLARVLGLGENTEPEELLAAVTLLKVHDELTETDGDE